jgi:plasmid stability protein
MSTLYVRNVPGDIHESLRRRAKERKSSVSAEALRLLAHALKRDRPGIRELLEEIEEKRPAARRGTPSAAELIREDRDRR